MIINNNIKSFLLLDSSSIKEALRVIEENHNGFVIVVDEYGLVDGIMTDGDYRRWSINQTQLDLSQSVKSIVKKDFDYAFEKSGATAENSIMIGDDYGPDVLGAKEVGMDQVYFTKELQKDEAATFVIHSLLELKNIL